MKLTNLVFGLFFSVSLSAQITFQIDSVVIKPANPTPTTPVYMHIYGYCNQYTGFGGQPAVTHNGNNHSVDACYLVGLAMVITNIHDSIYLFTGPAGVHNVSWTVGYNYNAPPPCMAIAHSGSQSLNVVSTNVQPVIPVTEATIHFDPLSRQLNIFNAGNESQLMVSDVRGRMVRRQRMDVSDGIIELNDLIDGLYIVTLVNENMVMVRQKILVTR